MSERDTTVDVLQCVRIVCNSFHAWLAQSERAVFHCACADCPDARLWLQTLVKGA